MDPLNRANSIPAAAVVFCILLGCLAAQPAQSAELKPETAAAFDRYIGVSENRIRSETHGGAFLFIDEWPEARRLDAYARLRKGEIVVQQMDAQEDGHPVEVHHGLIHDWVGVLFIPHVTLAQTLAVEQDYNNHQNIYKPEVRHSRLVAHHGDDFTVTFQLYMKSLLTVVINADYDIHYERLGANRVTIRSHSTRLAEVQNAGEVSEHETPANEAHGYLWRLNSYWRFEEKDGGVYAQLESIGLSRTVPAVIAWLINPLLGSIPRGTLTNLLGATRTAVERSVKSPEPAKKAILEIKQETPADWVPGRADHEHR